MDGGPAVHKVHIRLEEVPILLHQLHILYGAQAIGQLGDGIGDLAIRLGVQLPLGGEADGKLLAVVGPDLKVQLGGKGHFLTGLHIPDQGIQGIGPAPVGSIFQRDRQHSGILIKGHPFGLAGKVCHLIATGGSDPYAPLLFPGQVLVELYGSCGKLDLRGGSGYSDPQGAAGDVLAVFQGAGAGKAIGTGLGGLARVPDGCHHVPGLRVVGNPQLFGLCQSGGTGLGGGGSLYVYQSQVALGQDHGRLGGAGGKEAAQGQAPGGLQGGSLIGNGDLVGQLHGSGPGAVLQV